MASKVVNIGIEVGNTYEVVGISLMTFGTPLNYADPPKRGVYKAKLGIVTST
jgi:hypothetical protein